MMKFSSRLRKPSSYASVLWFESETIRGARYAVRRVSLAQRIELTKRARELSLRHDFLKAGDASDDLEASLADLLIRRLYLEWGLAEVTGIEIDEQPATAEVLIEKGPEALANEIVAAVRGQLGLSEEERKNF
ncbi:MAG: hypothetical protein ACJ74Z_11100 [Bryobacteraceae bacterium]